jgi:hypothetical protein
VAATENIVALTDVDSERAAPTFKLYEKAAKYSDFRKMLDKEAGTIDAVVIATPDHMHGTAAMWCMERGKHVYVEKPLTRTVWEARQLTEAAARYKVATQMGNQGYSNDGARIAAEIIWSGEIGNVTEVHAWTTRPMWPQGMTEIPPPEPVPSTLDWDSWIGVAEMRPFTSGLKEPQPETSSRRPRFGFYHPFNWRGFFDFGCGPLGDMACHILGAVNMALLLGAPTSVEVIKQEGKSSFAFPKKSVTVFEFPARRNMAPVKIYWYDAATGPTFWPEGIPEDEPLIGGADAFGRQGPRPGGPGGPSGGPPSGGGPQGGPPAGGPGGAPGGQAAPRGGAAAREGVVFVGDKGFLTTDTYGAGVRLLPLRRHQEYELPPAFLTRSPGHARDWIRACKGGDPACSNFSVGGPFTEWIVMGVIALHFEGKLSWDANQMQFTNNREANEHVKPKFRNGWSFT